MRRRTIDPRPNWQQRVEQYGLTFHTSDGVPYWDESACYTFTPHEVDTLEAATNTLHEMCLELVQHVIDERLLNLFLIPPSFHDLVVESWNNDEPSLYGRFDLAFTGNGPPKLLEYNADTPTGLLEASVAQWYWLQDVEPRGDQFNSIHERLIDAWQAINGADPTPTHFTGLTQLPEDAMTFEYLRDTAVQAGMTTNALDIAAIGYDASRGQFVDLKNRPIRRIFKLYPWEWLVREDFGRNILHSRTQWLEPPWKMVLSNKAILPLLHQLYPDSPYLVPAGFDAPTSGDFVRKPIHAREGANIQVVRGGQVVLETDGPYDSERGVVYQQLTELPCFDGRYPVVGSWVIAGESAGIGIREDAQLVTTNLSRFIPHQMTN
jgi:glutathionylspermidine synthase